MFGIDDAVIGGLGAAGLDILGGQLSAAQNRQAMRMSADLQREFAQHGIQWRMEDAARAKVHPLAAMGMMPASATPIAIGDVSGEGFKQAGQDLSGAISRMQTQDQKLMDIAQIGLVSAQKDKFDAETALLNHELAEKKRASMTAAPGLGIRNELERRIFPEGQLPNAPVDQFSGWFESKAPQRMSPSVSDSFIEAGLSPDLEKVDLGGGLTWLAPSTRGQESPMEVWGEMPWYEKLSNILRNQSYWSKHGYPNWMDDFLRVKGGFEAQGPIAQTHDSGVGSAGTLPSRFLGQAGRRFLDWSLKQKRRYQRKFNR